MGLEKTPEIHQERLYNLLTTLIATNLIKDREGDGYQN
jgi:hypothetical protein